MIILDTQETTHDEQVTQLLPVVTPYMQHGYDMKLAEILARMLDITPEALIASMPQEVSE